MSKPDKVLRKRPLIEVKGHLENLKRVCLFHPKEIVYEIPVKMCVCGKGERGARSKKAKEMVQCDHCYEWFHVDCVKMSQDGYELCQMGEHWSCEWCSKPCDDEGYQRWDSDRKKAKKRHIKDRPRDQGVLPGGDKPRSYSAPQTWEGKVSLIEERHRRNSIKKRKLHDEVARLMDEGRHHQTDAEGMDGLQDRPVTDALIDEMIEANVVQIPPDAEA